jgi:hypothetical protein
VAWRLVIQYGNRVIERCRVVDPYATRTELHLTADKIVETNSNGTVRNSSDVTDRPRANEDRMADFFRDADRLSVPALIAWFADNVDIRFGNAPAIQGNAAAEDVFRQLFDSLSGMRHRREALVTTGDIAAQMSVVTYVRRDGSEVSMPVASHLRRARAQKIDRLWIYIDMAPLFSQAAS